jgi:Fe2+ or Zn2+ uptake regulation protein
MNSDNWDLCPACNTHGLMPLPKHSHATYRVCQNCGKVIEVSTVIQQWIQSGKIP